MINLLFILATIVLMAAPIGIEYLSFKKDNRAYCRFRIVIYTLVYFVGVTVALIFLKELIQWIESLSFVKWLAEKASINDRAVYLAKVIVAIAVNVAIGVLYLFLGKFVKIGLKNKSLLVPKKKDGTFSLGQRLETKVIKSLHNEIWFFVGKIFKFLSITLSIAYALIFAIYLLPALSEADWLPYNFISMLFEAGYIYPVLTLLVMWEVYFFLDGIERLEESCPELLEDESIKMTTVPPDFESVGEEVRGHFGEFYVSDIDMSQVVRDETDSANHREITKLIAAAIENDKRCPQVAKETYLNCIDKLCESEEKDKGAVINGPFFSEFSMYFLRYISVILARGDNIVFVCNNDEQIDEVYDYLQEGYSKIYSLFCDGFNIEGVNLDNPIWKIVKVSAEKNSIDRTYINDNSILVTNLAFLTSNEFQKNNDSFIHLLDTVVFVDTLKTFNTYNRQLAMLNTKLLNITRNNALDSKNKNINKNFDVRYMSRQVRYICFDDTRTSSLDKALENMLGISFLTMDSMRYSESTLVRCYNYESYADNEGNRIRSGLKGLEETIGVVMSTAVICAGKVSNVTVFAEETFPYEDIKEILSSNMGRLPSAIEKNPILVNKKFYNPDDYTAVIVVDSDKNLLSAVRKYSSMASDKPSLMVIFSRPYMMRDYFVANIDELWDTQLERIPMEVGGVKDFAQSILVKADAGGVSEKEICRLALDVKIFKKFAEAKDVNSILRGILEIYGLSKNERNDLYKHFEFTTNRDFDENGEYEAENKVHLRRKGQLSDMINGRDMIRMVTRDKKEHQLSLPKSRLTQNYIEGQNLIYNGKVYTIISIDIENGYIYAELAMGEKNENAYEYIQVRKYCVELNPEQMEPLFSSKHGEPNYKKGDICVDQIQVSAFRAPMEVITNGYYIIDPHTCQIDTEGYQNINKSDDFERAKQAYRRYGQLSMPAYSTTTLYKAPFTSKENGAIMMAINLRGKFGPDIKKTTALAIAMLNELIHTMFPSTADAVAVVSAFPLQFNDEDSKQALRTLPVAEVTGEGKSSWKETDLTLLIIEDCKTDLGVVSALMTSSESVLDTLFDPLTKYLEWYLTSNEKSDYLHFGLDHAPSCFDFESLLELSRLLGGENSKFKFVDVDTIMEYESCDFCEKRYAKNVRDVNILEDSRKMCKACASKIVGNNKKELEAHLKRAKIFLESTYGISIGDYEVIFESTVKIVNTLNQNHALVGRGSDIPLKSYVDEKGRIHVECDIPSVNLSELLVREITHVWQMKHLPAISDEAAEGQIALVTVQYLRFLNNTKLANARTNYYESTSNISGEGYRHLVRDLLSNPQFRNNPFRYLIEANGIVSDDVIIPKVPEEIEIGDDTEPYKPTTQDRNLNGNSYFYYPRLSATRQRAYDIMHEAIKNHAPTVIVEGCTFEDIKSVHFSIAYDHPELFWYKNCEYPSMGSEITLNYGASLEEATDIQRRIDEIIPKYLEGITDDMSAYDVALRIYAKIISSVDYDSIALDREKKTNGPVEGEIDYLRTICGVFLNGKAVCEGYARAVQYLLQRCGVECAEMAGHIREENGSLGGGHAWNIVKIDGDYYFMDATWDDRSNTIQTVKTTDHGFDYFCITTDELLRTRELDMCPTEIPSCSALKANYFYHNNLVIDSYDFNKIKAIAIAAAEKDKKKFVFKCKNEAVFDEVLRRFCSESEDCSELIRAAAKVNKKIDTGSYGISNNKTMLSITISFERKGS